MEDFIRKIEKIVKTDIRYLFREGSWLVLGQIISTISIFITSVAFASFVLPQIYGTYKYIQSIISIISNFTITGFSTSIIRSSAKNNDGVLVFSVKKSIFWSAPTIIIGFAIAVYYSLQENYTFAIAILISIILFIFSNAWLLYGPFLSGKKQFKLNTYYTSITTIFTAITLITVMLWSPGVVQLALAYFLPPFILNWIFYVFTREKFVKNNSIDITYYKESIHFSLANVIAGIAQNIDKVIVFKTLGSIDLAVYSFAIAIPDQIRAMLKVISRLAFPKFVERKWSVIREHIRTKSLTLTLGSVMVAGIYIFLAPYIYELFFPAYTDSIIYSQFAALGIVTAAGSLSYAAIQSHGKTKETYSYIIITSMVQIITVTIGVIYFGLTGAIVALIFNRFFSAVLSYWLARKEIDEAIISSEISNIQR